MKKIKNFMGSWTGIFLGIFFFIFFIAQLFVIPSTSMYPTLKVGDKIMGLKFSYGVPIPTLPLINLTLLPDYFDNGHLIEGDKPQRGDVVVFKLPLQTNMLFVKRCIATGGDEIIFTKKNTYLNFKNKSASISENTITLNNKIWIENPYKEANYNPEKKDAFDTLVDILNGKNDKTIPFSEYINVTPIYISEFKNQDLFTINGEKYNAFYKKVEKDKFYMIGDNRDNSWDSRFWGSLDYKYVVAQLGLIIFSSEIRDFEDVSTKAGKTELVLLNKECNGTLDKNCKNKWEKEYAGKVRTDRMFSFVK